MNKIQKLNLINASFILGSFILCFINNYLGHKYPPFSISKTPVFIGLVATGILYFTHFKFFIKLCWISFFFLLNDILIKIYAGGSHDAEGLGWISFFEFLALLLAIFISFMYRSTREKIPLKTFLGQIAICTFFILLSQSLYTENIY